MSESTLQALLWDAISVGASLPVLKGLVNAVHARHGHYRLQKPVGDQGGYQRPTKALARFPGTQQSTCSPFIKTWWSDCCNMPRKNTTGVCVAGQKADVGLAGSLTTSGETRFAGSATLSDA